jgi:hypothetical protein
MSARLRIVSPRRLPFPSPKCFGTVPAFSTGQFRQPLHALVRCCQRRVTQNGLDNRFIDRLMPHGRLPLHFVVQFQLEPQPPVPLDKSRKRTNVTLQVRHCCRGVELSQVYRRYDGVRKDDTRAASCACGSVRVRKDSDFGVSRPAAQIECPDLVVEEKVTCTLQGSGHIEMCKIRLPCEFDRVRHSSVVSRTATVSVMAFITRICACLPASPV